MAFTKTPETSTYQTKQFPFVGQFNTRATSGSKDQRYVNCFPESIKTPLVSGKRIYLVKRPGLTSISSVTAGTARGCFRWNSKIYSVVGDKLYSGTTNIKTLGTSTGTVGFVPASDVTSSYLFVVDGTDGYIVSTSDTVTQVNPTYSAWAGTTAYSLGDKRRPTVPNSIWYQVTTAGTTAAGEPVWPTTIGDTVVDGTVTWTATGYYGGFPSPHIPTPVYADGYIFLAQANTDNIYNSDLDLPLSWNPINILSAEMYPDNLVALKRQNNQIVAFGETGIEYFYDAGNAGQSPLARNDGAAQRIGSTNTDSVCANERALFFISQSELGGRAAWMISDFKPEKISIEWVDKLLEAEGSSISTSHSYLLRVSGHLFYVINLTSRTLVYDTEEKMWHEWSSNSSGSHAVFACPFSCDGLGYAYLQHTSNGKIYQFNPTIYQDDGVAILFDAVSGLFDDGSNNRKVCNRFTLLSDKTSTSSLVTVSYSDDDYTTWSTGRTVDLSVRPFLTRLGMFRRRAFRLQYTDNLPFRVEDIELDLNVYTN